MPEEEKLPLQSAFVKTMKTNYRSERLLRLNSSRTHVRLGAWFWSAKADIFFSESLHILAERLSQSEIELPLRMICYYSPLAKVGVSTQTEMNALDFLPRVRYSTEKIHCFMVTCAFFPVLQGFPVFEKSCFLFFCNFVKSHLGQCTLPEHIIPHIIRVFPDTHDLWHFHRTAWKPLQPDRNALLFIILEFDQKSLSGICISLLHKNTSSLTCAEVSRDIQIRQLFFHLILPVLLCVNALSCPGTPPALILSSSLSFLLPPYFLVPAKPAGFFLPPAFALYAAQCRTFPLSSIVSSVIFTYTNKNCSERVLRYRQRFFPADIRLYGQIIQRKLWYSCL